MKNIPFEGYGGPRLSRQAQLNRLHNVIRQELTDAQREVLVAYYFQHKTVTRIAQERGVCRSTVSRTLRRAEQRIRTCLRY